MAIRIPQDASRNVQAAFQDTESRLSALEDSISQLKNQPANTDVATLNQKVAALSVTPSYLDPNEVFRGGTAHALGYVPDPGDPSTNATRSYGILSEGGRFVQVPFFAWSGPSGLADSRNVAQTLGLAGSLAVTGAVSADTLRFRQLQPAEASNIGISSKNLSDGDTLIQVLPQGAGGTSLAQRYMNIMGSVGVIGSLSAETIRTRNLYVSNYDVEKTFIRTVTQTSNSGSVENFIIIKPVPPNTFYTNCMGFRGKFHLTFAGNSNTKTFKMYLGSNSITLYSGAASGVQVVVWVWALRNGSTTMYVTYEQAVGTSSYSIQSAATLTVADFTVSNNFQVSIQGTSNSDIRLDEAEVMLQLSGEMVA